MFCSVELFDSFDFNGVGSCALDPGSHFVKKIGQINDFGFFRDIFYNRCPFSKPAAIKVFSRSETRKIQMTLAPTNLSALLPHNVSLIQSRHHAWKLVNDE